MTHAGDTPAGGPQPLTAEERAMGLADWMLEAERKVDGASWMCPEHGLKSIYVEHELGDDTTTNAYCYACVIEYIDRYQATVLQAEQAQQRAESERDYLQLRLDAMGDSPKDRQGLVITALIQKSQQLAASAAEVARYRDALDSIIVRCEEGDKLIDWLPTIASIAHVALDLTAVQPFKE